MTKKTARARELRIALCRYATRNDNLLPTLVRLPSAGSFDRVGASQGRPLKRETPRIPAPICIRGRLFAGMTKKTARARELRIALLLRLGLGKI